MVWEHQTIYQTAIDNRTGPASVEHGNPCQDAHHRHCGITTSCPSGQVRGS